MNDIVKSIRDWLKEKTSSPLYFTYLIFLIAWNWKFFHILFLEDASLFSLPRVEYISHNIELTLTKYSIINGIINISWHILPPVLFTILAVIYLPRVQAWAHSIYLKYYFDRKRAYDIASLEYEKRRTQLLKTEVAQKKIQKTQIEQIEKAQTQEEKWEKELEKVLLNDNDIEAIRAAHRAVYQTEGLFTAQRHLSSSFESYIQPNFLSRLDTLNIIIFSKDKNNRSIIQFTEKGKFFLRRLQEQNKIF